MGVTTGAIMIGDGVNGNGLGMLEVCGADAHEGVEAEVAFTTELNLADLVAPLINMKHEFGR